MKKFLFLINLVVLLAVCQGAWAQSGSWLDEANLPAGKIFSKVNQDGNGNTVIRIQNEKELALLAYNFRTPQNSIQANTIFILEKDLNMSAHYWEPCDFSGDSDNETGQVTTIIFDGNGHTISGIYTESGQDEVGLFRLVNYATIKNVKLARSTITGSIWAGGLVSVANYGVSILNCYVGDDVIINSSGGGIAGLFGNTTNEKECSIVGCVSAATINGSESGGIVGYFHRKATLKDCLYIGSSISGNNSCGAMVGYNNGDDNAITNCYYTNPSLTGTNSSYDVLAYSVSGGTDGMTVSFETPTTNYDVSGIGAFTKGMMYNGKRYGPNGDIVLFSVSSDDESKIIVKVKANDTPLIPEEGNNYRLPIENTDYTITCEMATMSWEGEGTYAMPYLISTCDEMNQLAIFVNAGYAFSNNYFRLENDLDFTGRNYLPVGFSDSAPFGGTFDGQGKTISGISFSIGDQSGIDINKATIGIFGAVSGTVKNLRLAGSSIEGGNNTGGIVGTNNGTVTNCHVGSNVSISSFGQWRHIGGIVGYNIGTIDGCTSAASVSTTNDVNGYGGIVGNNVQGGTVKNCLYLGNSVSAGNSTYVGAIAGYTNYGTFSNNLYHPASDSGMKAIGGDETAYDAEGAERGYSITSSTDGLTLNFNNAYRTYEYNGIALYVQGMMFDGVFYASAGRQVDFTAAGENNVDVRDLAASAGTLSGESPSFSLIMPTEDVVITANVAEDIVLYNNADNTETLESYNGRRVNATLQGRTLLKNGQWFPLCLPFNVKNFEGTPLEGANVQRFNNSGSLEGTLYMGFRQVTEIEAGAPYLVKWEETGDPVVNPEFRAVIVDNELHPKGTGASQFRGNFSPVILEKDNRHILYMGANSTLYYPAANITLNSMRCYFYLYGQEAVEPRTGGAANASGVMLTFDNGETLRISALSESLSGSMDFEKNNTQAIYDLQGRKVHSSALPKGIYIVNGKKVVK